MAGRAAFCPWRKNVDFIDISPFLWRKNVGFIDISPFLCCQGSQFSRWPLLCLCLFRSAWPSVVSCRLFLPPLLLCSCLSRLTRGGYGCSTGNSLQARKSVSPLRMLFAVGKNGLAPGKVWLAIACSVARLGKGGSVARRSATR